MNEVSQLKPTCSSCKKRKPVRRNYVAENCNVVDITPKTVGSMANKNANKLSADEKASIHRENNAYKNKPLEIPLGPGMEQVKRDSQGHIQVSEKQSRIDKRKNNE